MWSFIVFRFIFHLLISSVTFVLGISDSCVTRNQEYGRCMSLNDCGLTADVLFTSPEAFNYAKNSKCGSGGAMVCCSSSGYKHKPKIIISTTPSQQEKIRISTFSESSVCGIHASSNKIQGGILTEFEEFPWLAALEYVSNYDHQNKGIRCGGSLLSQRFVLSAAHCIRHHELVLVKVWLGATNVSKDGRNCLNVNGDTHCVDSIQKFNVMKTFAHPLYNSFEKMNDIGLIQLEHLVNFTSFLRPICLPSSNSFPLPIQSYLTVSGWGATENSTSSDIKLKVDVPLQTNSACEKLRTWGQSKITSEQLCVGGESGRDSCPGDSGGPLMKSYRIANGDMQWVQVGIVSYGLGCGVRGRPAIYVKVASYVDWIVEVISGKGSTCVTPNKETAICIPLEQCEEIYTAIATGGNAALEFARESLCGSDQADPLVCCGSTGTRSATIIKDGEELLADYDLGTALLPDKSICGLVEKTYKISGKKFSDYTEFPWSALLEYTCKTTNEKEIKCGATIINNKFVLTAAHCLTYPDYELTGVILGDWKLSTDPDCLNLDDHKECAPVVKKFKPARQIKHHFYNADLKTNDIALVKLDKNIIYDGFSRPICLPPTNLLPSSDGTVMTITGWGANESGPSSDTKTRNDIKLLGDCQARLVGLNITISKNQQCLIGEAGKDSCWGDSGGAVMKTYKDAIFKESQWYLEGLISWDGGCAKSEHPIIFQRIPRYVNWIKYSVTEDDFINYNKTEKKVKA